MTRYLVSALILFALALITTSCSDDDCAECPAAGPSPTLYAIGTMASDGNRLDLFVDVFDIAAAGTDIDSALVDGDFTYCCVREQHQVTAQDGRQVIANLGSETCPSGVVTEFTPGDTTELAIYCEGRAHTARLHVLDLDGDQPDGLAVHVNQEAEALDITWNAVPEAEWYAVKMEAFSLSGPYHEWTYACVDTNFVSMALQPFGLGFTREVDLYIAAASGPMPTADHPVQNISGDHIAGTIYSLSSDRHMNIVLIRSERPDPEAAAATEVPSLADLLVADGALRR